MIVTERPPRVCGLQWCVNPSFEDYVLHSATEGKVTADEGARLVADSTYFFPAEADQHGDAMSFRGRLSYTAYFGILDVQISSPRLVAEADSVRLAIQDPDSWSNSWSDFGFVTATAIHACETTPVTLGVFGAELFMNKYPAGSALGRVQLIGADQRKET